ncbi:uncharacterized protein LOC101235455 isoform X1 [Hydra vulgaris]|uniref:uncharacterized protein LOC101235455 isoform X1 n=3 Tax=Hydra vulgaris TaxID=6087 RepID=UPI001F5EBA7B|nr:uncharacterized protein LOC101235455 isoform X1 [Hydra vulgaris]XP_047128636.1 uncharacterized protein LOC101235455 isoform X2 [Hydra vulgaris]
MDTEVSEFIDNFLEKVEVGQTFSGKDLEKLLDVVDGKLNLVSTKMEEIEAELEIEHTNLESSSYNNHCEFDPLAVQCFLNNIIQAAERNVGFEDHIVKILVDFCYHNCIVLPSSSLITSLNYLSINSLENDLLTDQNLLWSKLLIKMRNGLTNMLASLPMTNINMNSSHFEFVDFLNKRRFYLFQLLNVLLSFNETMSLYCKVRENQLLLNQFDNNDNSVKALSNLERAMEHHHIMLNEDLKLIQSIFIDELDVSSMNRLLAVYSKDICSKLREFTVFYSNDHYMNDCKVFTIKDLKLFAKVFTILQKWHEQIKTLVVHLNDGKVQNNKFLFEVYEDIGEHLQWEKELNEFYPALNASVVSYLKCLPNAIFQDSDFLKMVYISDELLLINPAYPKKVSFKCSQFLTLIFEMLVFTKVKDISETIHATISDVFDQYYNHLKQIYDSFNTSEKKNIDILNMILCDSVLLESILTQWDENEFKKRHGVYYLLIQKFKNLKTELISLISTYHLFTLRSALVYDVHSNNWNEERKFYEDERCSFPVQMWNFYIRGVVYDLIDMMPHMFYYEILYKISKEMLIFFTARYSIVKPSYYRLSQLKVDLIVLLKSFQWLCFHLMDDDTEFFNKAGKFKLFHALLTTLTHIMTILLAPLNLIADFFGKKSFSEIHNLHWRDFVLNMSSDEKMLVILEILTNKPCFNKRLLLKLLMWNNVELPISICHYSSYLLNATIAESTTQNINCMFVTEKVVKFQSIKKKQIAHCFYDIFLSYSHTSFIFFMASMIKDDYSKSFKKNDVEELPLWLQLIADNISSVLKRILKPAFELIFEKDRIRATPSFNFTNIQSLPCGCATAPGDEEKAFQSWPIQLHDCLVLTLNSLVDNIAIFPKVIWVLLVYVRDECNFAPSWIKQKQLGTKVLASLLYNWLSNPYNITYHSYNANISPETLDKVKMFSELLWHVVYNLTHDVTENPKVSMDVYKYLQSSSEIIMKKLSDLDAWCNLKKHEIDLNEGNHLLIEKKNDSLQFIYSLLKHNKVSVKEIIINKNAVSIEKLHENFNTLLKTPEIDFNPLSEFKMVGEECLEYTELALSDYDWNMFFPMVPFSKWKTLLMNKFQFQESAESTLFEHEKDAIKKIKKFITLNL